MRETLRFIIIGEVRHARDEAAVDMGPAVKWNELLEQPPDAIVLGAPWPSADWWNDLGGCLLPVALAVPVLAASSERPRNHPVKAAWFSSEDSDRPGVLHRVLGSIPELDFYLLTDGASVLDLPLEGNGHDGVSVALGAPNEWQRVAVPRQWTFELELTGGGSNGPDVPVYLARINLPTKTIWLSRVHYGQGPDGAGAALFGIAPTQSDFGLLEFEGSELPIAKAIVAAVREQAGPQGLALLESALTHRSTSVALELPVPSESAS